MSKQIIKIKTYEKEELEFKIKKLKDDGTISSKDKDTVWDDLLEFIGDGLGLAEKSCFILINANNDNEQIEDAGELYDHWNEFANGKMKNCIFNMRCLVIKKRKKTWTWYPKGADDPKFQRNLEKEDWDKHLKDLMKLIKLSLDSECLQDKKEKVLKSGDDLKKIWSNRYGDEQPCYIVLNVVEINSEPSGKSSDDNDKEVEIRNKICDDEKENKILNLSNDNTIVDISQPIWDAEYKEYDTKIEELGMVLSERKSGQQEIVTRICQSGGYRIKSVVECFEKNIKIKKIENPKEIAKFVTIFMENIITAADLFCKNYAAMQTNFELAQAIIKWKPYSSGMNPNTFWEAVTFGCQTIVSQLIEAIKVLGKLEEMFGVIRSGLFDFKNRIQNGESMSLAMQGVSDTFNKSHELLKVCQQYTVDAQQTELFIAAAFQKSSRSKEVENAFKNIKKIMEDMKETKKEKMELQREKNKIDEKMGGLAKSFGDVQEKVIACEFEIFIAKHIEGLSKEWLERKNSEYRQQMQNYISWCNSDKLDTVENISVQFINDCKNITSERIKQEKENAEKKKQDMNHLNLQLKEEQAKKTKLIGSTGQRIQELDNKIDRLENKLKDIFKSINITENIDTSIFEQFFKCSEKLGDGLNLNKKCLQNAESSINAISQWFEKNCGRGNNMETLLKKNGLQVLIPFLSKIGVNNIMHLRYKDAKTFEDKFSKPLVQKGADKKDIKKLQDFCEKLTPHLSSFNKPIESGSKEEGLALDLASHLEKFLETVIAFVRDSKGAITNV